MTVEKGCAAVGSRFEKTKIASATVNLCSAEVSWSEPFLKPMGLDRVVRNLASANELLPVAEATREMPIVDSNGHLSLLPR